MSSPPPPADGSLPLSLEQRLDTLCCRFEAAWRAEERPSIEQYLGEVPQEARAALLGELLAVELAYRRAGGGPGPTLEEYQLRFPERTALLQKVFTPRQDPCSTCGPEPPALVLGPQATAGGARYLPVRWHARGGLGEVHVAQDVELHREVALKRMQDPYADDPEFRRRFLLEAQITGWLEHPGVVPVHGLGHDPDGRPCYAMRFIRGESLRDAIRKFHEAERPGRDPTERRLAMQGLLGRFVAVCNTVAYAHSKGVIHRDLKPANVMLGAFGETLVVDWGLAKFLRRAAVEPATGESAPGPAFPSDGAETRAGSAVGTPSYMSPEQAAGDWDRVGPASDIYSLGATLYEALVNRPPVEGATVDEALGRARRGEFPPPRQVWREASPALEAICLKAMAQRPEARYATATELAGDVERWLADEPVSAYPDGWALRARRWAKRHRTLVTGAATLLVTAVLALSWLLNLESRARRAAERAEEAAEGSARREAAAALRAMKETEKAREMFDFLVKTFKTADALGIEGVAFRKVDDRGKRLTAGEILERGEKEARERLKDEPLLRAHLLDSIGHVYRGWGEYDRAKNLLEESRDLRRDQGAGPVEVAASLHGVGRCHHDLGDYEEAERHYRQALEIQSQHLKDDDPRVIATSFDLGWLLAENRHPGGEKRLQEVIEARRRALGEGHRDVAVARLALAVSLSDQGRSWEAGLLSLRAAGGLGDELAGVVRQGIAAIGARRGKDHRKAEAEQRKALALLTDHLGNRHPYVAVLWHQLAQTLQAQGNAKDAEKCGWECLQALRASVGYGHPLAIIPVEFQADLLARKGATAEGEKLYRELADRRRERFGDRHPLVGVALVKAAMYLTAQGGHEKQAEARRLLGQANGILLDNAPRASKYPAKVHLTRNLGSKEPVDLYLAFSPDGRRYFTGGHHPGAGVYDADTGECLRDVGPHQGGVYGAAFAPDGRHLLTAELGGLLLWPAGPCDPSQLLAAAAGAASCAAAPGTGLWCAASSLVAGTSGRGEGPRRMPIPPNHTHNVAVSRDGKRVLSSGQDGIVRVFDLTTLRPVAELRVPQQDCYATFSPDGQYVLSGHTDGVLRLWRATGGEVRQLRGHKGAVKECYFLPGGKQAVSYAEDNTLRVWDVESGREVTRHGLGDDPVAFRGVAVSPDGRRFLCLHSKSRSVRLCEVNSGKEVHRFELHPFFREGAGGPEGVAFSPDGRRAVCGSKRGLVYLFHLPE